MRARTKRLIVRASDPSDAASCRPAPRAPVAWTALFFREAGHLSQHGRAAGRAISIVRREKVLREQIVRKAHSVAKIGEMFGCQCIS
jgi:hypothetical protein